MKPLTPLPIDELLPELVAALEAGPCLVLEAPPGAGKTTRVPQALLRSDLLAAASSRAPREIWVVQPRRIAARLAAERVAEELGERVGQRVGYHVRFEDISSPATRLRFLTEGVLVRRFLSDPELSAAKVIILDEFHERHLSTDLALALVRRLQQTRGDLKLVVMSATLDAAAIAQFLDACPLLRSSGRQYPLEIEHLPQPDERPLEKQVASAVRSCLLEGQGDSLVFLPGSAEIRRAAQALEKLALEQGVTVLPLHGDLPLEQQARVLQQGPRRKVVLATNVAESSVTVPGVTRVIDSGLARSVVHSPWSGLASLALTKVSRASATQRAGRAGRLGPGKVLRLYTRGDFESRPEQDKPELLTSDLAETLLTIFSLGLGSVSGLAWLTPPPEAALKAAQDLLTALGAFDAPGQLSALGRRLAQLPLHPRLARLVLAGQALGAAHEACCIAALLSERDIRLEQRVHFSQSAPAANAATSDSDAIELLDRFEEALDVNFERDRLRALELDARSVTAVDRVRRQLERLVKPANAAPPTRELRDAALRQAVLSAFPDRVARRRSPGRADLILANGSVAKLAESSVVRQAALLVALDGSARGRAGSEVRLASAIEPEWLLDYPELCSEREELIWNAERQRVERVSQICCGSVVLEETRVPAVPSPATSDVLLRAARAKGLHFFDPAGELAQLLSRLATLGTALGSAKAGATADLELEEDVRLGQDNDDGSLVLERACSGLSSFEELLSVGLVKQLEARLRPQTLALLEKWVPEHITVGARRLRVHYELAQGPWVESRLQDFFGQTSTPQLCAGRLAVTVHLLAPNQRAVQVTRDLEGFWQRHYPQIRKELCRRYPRHPWPEDGRTAAQPPARPARR